MIKSIGAAQGGPPPEPAKSVVASPNQEPGNLEEPTSRLEKRRHLAQIIRVNLLDCFDDSGAFDLARAQRVLPACAVQSLVIHETTKTDKAGTSIVQRRITLRLVDKVRAMRLDDALEDKQEKAAHADALKKIAHLEKALIDADNRELCSSRDLEEKDRELEALKRSRPPKEAPDPSSPSLTLLPSVQIPLPPTPDLSAPESVKRVKRPAARAEAQRLQWEEMQIQSKIREIEHCQNTSGTLGFASRYPQWPQEAEARRAYARRLIKTEAEAAEHQKIAKAQRAADRELAERTRPPRKRGPIHAFNF